MVRFNDEKLVDFFSDFDCKVLLEKTKLKRILEELAHKELIQKPQYVSYM